MLKIDSIAKVTPNEKKKITVKLENDCCSVTTCMKKTKRDLGAKMFR